MKVQLMTLGIWSHLGQGEISAETERGHGQRHAYQVLSAVIRAHVTDTQT